MYIDVLDGQHVEVEEAVFCIDTGGCWLNIGLSSGAEVRLFFRDYEEALKFRAKLECIVDAAPKLRDATDGKPVIMKR